MEFKRWSISDRKVVILGFAAILIALLVLSFTSPVHRWGDGSTYYMMIDSIASDGDIKYEKKDIDRALLTQFDDLPAGLFLVKDSEGNFYYGKEFTYALFASPFFVFFGKTGILVFNSIMFFLMIIMGYLYLRISNSRIISFSIAVLFFFFSTWYIYIYWIHADLYNTFLVTLGFFLWFIYLYNKDLNNIDNSYIYLVLSLIVFGVATFSKTPNIACIIPVLCYEMYNRDYKKGLSALLIFGVTCFILYISYYIITGNLSPYTMQHGYVGNYPFTPDYNPELDHGAAFASDVFSKTSVLSLLGLQVMALNLFYYIFGRFTGIFWYYPFLIFSIFVYFTEKVKKSENFDYSSVKLGQRFVMAAIVLNILMYIFISYDSAFNYFGGGHAVGNRYFHIHPAFLFLIGKIEFSKKNISCISLFFIISILFVLPINLSPIDTSAMPMEHTTRLPFNMLPLEYTLLDDNLPLWNPLPITIDGNTFYFPNSNIKIDGNIFAINGDYPELLFKSGLKDTITISLLNPNNDGEKLVSLTSSSKQKDFILQKGQVTTIEMQIEPLLRIHESSYIYKLGLAVTPLASASTNNIIVAICRTPSDQMTFYFTGWHHIEYWNDIFFRWMENDATFMIYSDENRVVDLSFNAVSFYRPRSVEIYINDLLQMEAEVPSDRFTIMGVPGISLKEGANIVRFHVPEGCERPADKKELNNPDSRCLSLAVQDIRISRDIIINDLESSSISLASGWHGLEDWGGTPARWIENDAVLLIESGESRTAELSFKALSFYRPRILEVYTGDALELNVVINASGFAAIKTPVHLKKGTNIISFLVPEGCERPCNLPELNNPDSRCLSLAFEDVSIDDSW